MEEASVIDWGSDQTHVLLNPRLAGETRDQLERIAGEIGLPAHIWIATSGTTSAVKLCALSKKAMLASAASVNRHLDATREDSWCSVLPSFHVGGLAIHARASLTGAAVFTGDWNPAGFVALAERTGATLTSLVPAQVFELAQAALKAPPRLRAVIVGGAALSEDLYQGARALGWNLLPSYGMTECASQIATASPSSLDAKAFPDLELLSHLRARREPDGRLAFAGSSLLTGYGFQSEGQTRFVDPKIDGWFVSDDYGAFETVDARTVVRVEGRGDDFLKIGGELVSFARLEAVFDSINAFSFDATLVAMPDQRLGHIIALAIADDAPIIQDIVDRFNEKVLPFERIRRTVRVPRIPRSPLGKVARGELLRLAVSAR